MATRSLDNPETLLSTVYAPDGQTHQYPYIPTSFDIKCMARAIYEAKLAISEGNVAVGATLAYMVPGHKVYDFKSAHSTEISDDNLKAHAEDNVYREVQPELGRNLRSSMLYVTTEPCNGCTHDYVIQGEIGTLFIASNRDDTPEYFRRKNWTLDKQLRDAGREIMVVSGLLREEVLNFLVPDNKVHSSSTRTPKKSTPRPPARNRRS